MTRYQRNRKELLHNRAMAGVVAKQRKRIAERADMRDVGGITTDGCLGQHTIRLLAWPDEARYFGIVADGRHSQARTYRGIWRVLTRMIHRRAT